MTGRIELPPLRLVVELGGGEAVDDLGIAAGQPRVEVATPLVRPVSVDAAGRTVIVVIRHLSIYGAAFAAAVGTNATGELHMATAAADSAGDAADGASTVLGQIELLRAQLDALSALAGAPERA